MLSHTAFMPIQIPSFNFLTISPNYYFLTITCKSRFVCKIYIFYKFQSKNGVFYFQSRYSFDRCVDFAQQDFRGNELDFSYCVFSDFKRNF